MKIPVSEIEEKKLSRNSGFNVVVAAYTNLTEGIFP